MIPQPDVRPISEKLYRLWENYCYTDTSKIVKPFPVEIRVPEGFEYDGASVPRWLWSLSGMHNDGLMRAASLIHDYLYVNKGNVVVYVGEAKCAVSVSRAKADRLFLDMLKLSEVSWRKRNAAYLAVRVGGWIYWKG